MRKKRHRQKSRQLWDGRYKPYYEITFLDDIDPDARMIEEEVIGKWWSFLDNIEPSRS